MSALESLLRLKSSSAIDAEDLLAVVSDPDSETAVKSLIVDQSIAKAHVQRGTIDDAIELLKKLDRSPRQLIVDVSGSAMPISDLARLSDVCDPSVAVVVVGDRNDVDLYRSLLGAGVQDFLSEISDALPLMLVGYGPGEGVVNDAHGIAQITFESSADVAYPGHVHARSEDSEVPESCAGEDANEIAGDSGRLQPGDGDILAIFGANFGND